MMLNFGSLYSKKKFARYIDLHLGQVVAIQKSNITIGQILMRSFSSQWYLLFLFFLFIKPSKALFTNYTHHLAQSSSREHLQLSNNVIPGKPTQTTQTAITLKPGQERIHEHATRTLRN